MAFVSELPESGTLISTGTVITITWDTDVKPLITYIPTSGPEEVVSSASPSAVFGPGYTGTYGIDGPNWTIAFRRDAGWTTSPFVLSILDAPATETQINYTLLAEGQYPTDMQPFNDPIAGSTGGGDSLEGTINFAIPDNDVVIPSANPLIFRGAVAGDVPLTVNKAFSSTTVPVLAVDTNAAAGLVATFGNLANNVRWNITPNAILPEPVGGQSYIFGAGEVTGVAGALLIGGMSRTDAGGGGDLNLDGGHALGASGDGGDLTLRAGGSIGGTPGKVLVGSSITSRVDMGTSTNEVRFWNGLTFEERADHPITPVEDIGQLWVKDDGPNVLMFTDDEGKDFDLTKHTAGSGSGIAGDVRAITVKGSPPNQQLRVDLTGLPDDCDLHVTWQFRTDNGTSDPTQVYLFLNDDFGAFYQGIAGGFTPTTAEAVPGANAGNNISGMPLGSIPQSTGTPSSHMGAGWFVIPDYKAATNRKTLFGISQNFIHEQSSETRAVVLAGMNKSISGPLTSLTFHIADASADFSADSYAQVHAVPQGSYGASRGLATFTYLGTSGFEFGGFTSTGGSQASAITQLQFNFIDGAGADTNDTMLAISVGDVIWLRSQTTGLLASWTVGGPIFNAPGPLYEGLTNLGDGSVPLVIGAAYDVGFIETGAASFDAVINAGASTDNDVIVPSPDPIILRDGAVPTTAPLTVVKTGSTTTVAALEIEISQGADLGLRITEAGNGAEVTIAGSGISLRGNTASAIGFGGGTTSTTAGLVVVSGIGTTTTSKSGELRLRGGDGANGTSGDGGDVTIEGGFPLVAGANGSINIGLQSPTEIEFGQGFTVGETDNHPVPAVGGKGQYWARTSDGKPVFTDRGGTDFDLAASGAGDVVGPGSATDHSVALFDTTSGKLLKDGVALGTSGQVLTSGGAGVPPAFATVAGTGDVVGPGSAIDNSVPLFNTTTGKLLKDGVALGTSGQVLTSGGAGVPPSFEDAASGSGDVVGPGPSVTGDAVARFDDTGGLTIQESPVIIGDTGNVTGVLDITAETITAQSGAEATEYAEYGIAPYGSRITQFTIGGSSQTGTVIDVSLLGMVSGETGLTGGTVNVFAGNATVGDADGGDLNLSGGAGFGSGALGKVVFEGSEVQLLNVPLTTNSTIDGIDIGVDVAANTLKVSNVNHTGEVTGDTALTIADNVVTLAKMAPGTAGALIVYDGSGDPVDIGVGSASDVLTSNASAIPTWEPAGAPGAHDLGGSSHNADTLANLNTKVTGATLHGAHIGDVTGDETLTIGALKVAEGMLQDDAVTLAKLDAGTPGGVIAYTTTTGNPVDVGVGALDQVLTTSTVGGPPTWQDPAGGGDPPATATSPNVDAAAAAIGSVDRYAREDHKHDTNVAIAGAATPGDSAAEGTADQLSRSDHQHGLPAFGTVATTFAEGDVAELNTVHRGLTANNPHGVSIGNILSGSVAQFQPKITDGPVITSQPNEFNDVIFTTEASPAATDLLIVERASDGAKRTVEWQNLPAGAGGHTIQEEGGDLTARTNLNFIGTDVLAADNAGNDATDVTVPRFSTSTTAGGTVVGSNGGAATVFLNATGAWSTPSGGGDVSFDAGTVVDNQITRYHLTTGTLIQGGTDMPSIDDSGNIVMVGTATVDGIDVSVDVGANTTHSGSAGTDHSDVGLNNTHRALTEEHRIIIQDITANKPAAGTSGRYFFSTDDFTMEFDTGSVWQGVGLPVDDTTLEATTDLHIKDDGVTLAKMDAGTAGALIVYDGSGNPVDIGVGGAGDVLTSNVGAIATWEAAGAPGAHDLGGASHTSTGQAEFRIVEADGSNGTRWADPAGGTPATTVATSDASTGVVGADTEYARQDHEHQVVTTGTPGNATPGDTAGAGTSDSLARLDHQHGLPAFGTGSTQFCVGDDARLSDARAPTSHAYDSHSGTVPLADVATGTPGGVIGYAVTTGIPTDIGIGTSGQVLTSNVSATPTWEDQTGGGQVDTVAGGDGVTTTGTTDITVDLVLDGSTLTKAAGGLKVTDSTYAPLAHVDSTDGHPLAVAATSDGFLSGADKTLLDATSGSNTGDSHAYDDAAHTGTLTLNKNATGTPGGVIAYATTTGIPTDIGVGALDQILTTSTVGQTPTWEDPAAAGAGSLDTVITGGTPDNDVTIAVGDPLIFRADATGTIPLTVSKAFTDATVPVVAVDANAATDMVATFGNLANSVGWEIKSSSISPVPVGGQSYIVGSGSVTGVAGNLLLIGMSRTDSGDGGDLSLDAGTAQGASGDGGDIKIRAGGTTGGAEGDILIGAATTAAVRVGASGTDIEIIDSTGSNGAPGEVLGSDGTFSLWGAAGAGDVIGPATSTDQRIARFNGTDNKTIEDSLVAVTDTGSLTGVENITLSGNVDGIDVGVDVAANTTHRGSAGTDHSDVGLNNTHRGLTNEHIDWTAAGAETIHTNHYIEGGAGTDTTAIHTGDTDAVPNAMLADMAGFSVKAKPTTAAGVPTDLVVGTNTVLGRVAGDVVAAQVVDGQIATNTVTNAKVVQMAANTVKANATAGAANQADLAVGTNEVVGRVAGNIVAAQLVNDQIATATVVATGKLSATGTKNNTTFLRGDDTWDVPPGAGGIVTGLASARPAADGSQGFYYATDTQVLSYDDTSVWEEVGVVADDVTLELTADLHIKALGVDTAQLAAEAVTYAKIQNVVADDVVLGRISGADGVIEELTGANILTISGADAAGTDRPADEVSTSGTNVTISQTAPTGAGEHLVTTSATAAAWRARDVKPRALTIESPTATEDFSFFFTTVAITVTNVAVAVRGATPSITGTLVYDSARNSGGPTTIHTMSAVTSVTGTDGAPSGTATIPADSYIWLISTAVGAATDELFIGLTFTED